MCIGMTGYGRCDFSFSAVEGAGGGEARQETYTVEVKSLNHRYLDIHTRLPERFSPLDIKIRDVVKKTFSRGHVTLSISAGRYDGRPLRLNLDAARAYLEAEGELKAKLGVEGTVDVALLLGMKDIFTAPEVSADVENNWKAVEEGITKALSQALSMRRKEGEVIKEDVEKRLKKIETISAYAAKRCPEVVSRYRDKMKNEITLLLAGKAADESRVITEAAIFADRVNIDEEVTRLKSHVSSMRHYLALDEPVGRRLDFLCQEILREANTVGSKSQDVDITRGIIELKGELEKIREQVQNVE